MNAGPQRIVCLTEEPTEVLYALGKIVDPVLKPFRRILPLIGGFDLSPVLAILVILLIQTVVVAWLMNVGHTI